MREIVRGGRSRTGMTLESNPFDIEPDAFGDHAEAADVCRRRARLGAAQARGASLPPDADRAGQSVSAHHRRTGAPPARRRAVPPLAARRRLGLRDRTARRTGRRADAHAARSTSCGARTAAAVSISSRRRSNETERRRDPARHPRLPVLRVSRSIDGIPVMHLQPNATTGARARRAGQPVEARRAMFGLEDDPAKRAERVDALIASPRRDVPARSSRRSANIRGRLLSVPLRRSDLHRRPRGRARRGRHRAARRRTRDRHLRRLRPPDAIADGSVVAGAGAGRSVFREGLARPAIHGARLRAGVLRRQLADAVRARRVPLRDVLGRVHVHLDEAPVRRSTCCA